MSAVMDRLLERTRDLKARVGVFTEFDSAEHPRGKTTPASRGGSFAPVDLSAAADAIAKMDPHKRDNTGIGDFPGHASGYALYEARKMLPKPSEKLKRVTDSNSFALWQDYEYIANVDGVHFGVTKDEDPDEPDDESKFIFSFKRLDQHGKTVGTITNDVTELFAEMRKHLSVKILATADAKGRVTPSTGSVALRSRVSQPWGSPTTILAYADAAGRVYERGKTTVKSRGGSFAPKSNLETRFGREQISDSIYSGLTSDQQDFLFNYSGAGPDLSGELRGGEQLSPYSKRQLAAMDQIFDQNAVNIGPTTLFRIVDVSNAEGLLPGHRFTDKAFVSTSASTQGLASVIAGSDESGQESVRLHIEVPAGTRALPLSGKWNIYFRDQDEVLLRRDSNFEVVSRTPDLITLKLVLTIAKHSTYAISRPLYVCRQVENADQIIAWAKGAGFETTLSAEDMHVTVCYSKEPVDWLALDHGGTMLEVPPEGVRTLAWDEEKHPREPKGSGKGGEFTSVSGGVRAGEDEYGKVSPLKYRLSEKALSLRSDPRWGGSDDLLTVVDGHRAGGFEVLRGNRSAESEARRWNSLVREYGFSTEFTSAGRAVIAIRAQDVGSLDKKEFISAVYAYTKGLNTLNDNQERVLGKWLGYSKADTDAYLARKKAGLPVIPIGEAEKKLYSIGEGKLRISNLKLLSYLKQKLPRLNFEQCFYAARALTTPGEDGAVVLRFESAPLAARHQYFLDHGASWDYDEYHPHITLTYAKPDGLDLSQVEPYAGPIVLGPEQFQELETGWAEDIKEHAEDDTNGRWVTMNGRHVFIPEGETPEQALERSLKPETLPEPIFGNKDPYVYHLTGWKELEGIQKKGLVASKTGYHGAAVYLGNTEEVTQSYYRTSGALLRVRKESLIKKFGQYKDGGKLEFDDMTGEITLPGKTSKLPVDMLEVRTRGGSGYKWEPLASWQPFKRHAQYADKPTPTEIDYAQIKNDLDALEARFRDDLREALIHSRDAVMATVKRRGALPRDFTLPYSKDIQGVIEASLQRAMDRGGADAGKEIGKSKPRVKKNSQHTYAAVPTFSPKAALKWLREKIFWVADVLITSLEEDIRSVLLNGLRTGKPNSELVTAIAMKYIPYLGDPTAVKDGELPTAARLETVVRTNLVEAYNQGRISTYVRPDMMPFLDGIEYSAILDSRTTPVCRYLHGKVFKPEDIQATGLVPPNHFNALAEGMLITTSRGNIPVEQVVSGDLVMTHKGRWRAVYATMRKTHSGKIARLELSSGRVLWATEEHPLLMVGGWKAVRDLKVRDELFQVFEEGQRFEDIVTCGPENFPSMFDEDVVPYELTSYSRPTAVDRTVQFDHDLLLDKSKIYDVSINRVLEDEHDLAGLENISEAGFIFSRVSPPSFCGDGVSAFENSGHGHGIVSFHLSGNPRPLDTEGPMFASRPLGNNLRTSVSDAHLLFFGPDMDTVPFTPKGQGGPTEAELPFDSTQRFFVSPMLFPDQSVNRSFISQVHSSSPNWITPTIITLEGRSYNGWVYNLAVEEDESYLVEGVVSHNCRSLVVPKVVGTLSKAPDFKVDPKVYITDEEILHAQALADAKFLEQEDFAFDPTQARAPKGVTTGGQWVSRRATRALETHKPATREKQLKAAKYEATVARLIGGQNLDDHEPFDVIAGKHAVEVKVLIDGKHAKVTMHPESLIRKANYLRDERMTGHTVVIDARAADAVYYYKRGVGSFRLGSMQAVKATELKVLIGVGQYAVDDEGKSGEWKTINGRHIFIREGEDFNAALSRSLDKGKEDAAPENKLTAEPTYDDAKRFVSNASIETNQKLLKTHVSNENTVAALSLYADPETRLKAGELLKKWPEARDDWERESIDAWAEQGREKFLSKFWGVHAGGESGIWTTQMQAAVAQVGPNADVANPRSFWAEGVKPPAPSPKIVGWLNEEYAATQEKLPAESFHLYRGTTVGKGLPLESWSSDAKVAKQFARDMARLRGRNVNTKISSEVLDATVPKKFILATSKTIPGWSEEAVKGKNEFMVLGAAFHAGKAK